MRNALRLKLGRYMIPIPCTIWQRQVSRQARGRCRQPSLLRDVK